MEYNQDTEKRDMLNEGVQKALEPIGFAAKSISISTFVIVFVSLSILLKQLAANKIRLDLAETGDFVSLFFYGFSVVMAVVLWQFGNRVSVGLHANDMELVSQSIKPLRYFIMLVGINFIILLFLLASILGGFWHVQIGFSR